MIENKAVRQSVRIYQRGCHWTNFCEIAYWGLNMYICRTIQIWLKSDKELTLHMKT